MISFSSLWITMLNLRILKTILMIYLTWWWFRNSCLEEIATLPVLTTCLTTLYLSFRNCKKERGIKLSTLRKIYTKMWSNLREKWLKKSRRSKKAAKVLMRMIRIHSKSHNKSNRRNRNLRRSRKASSSCRGRSSYKMMDG